MSQPNYSSQLKGWAVDISSRILSKSDKEVTAEDLIKYADELVAYCFSPAEAEIAIREDIENEEYNRKMAEAIAMEPASNRADA